MVKLCLVSAFLLWSQSPPNESVPSYVLLLKDGGVDRFCDEVRDENCSRIESSGSL